MKAFLAIALLCCAAGAALAAPPTEKEVLGMFDAWNAALATKDPEAVADMYAEDSTLLPTLSNTPAINRELKLAYFEEFLKKSPQGKIDEYDIEILADDIAALAGIYTFTLIDPKTEEASKVQARFTYVFQKEGDKWLIKEHHSSLMPEKEGGGATLDDVADLFVLWNATLQTGNPEAVAALYHNTSVISVLLPTVSDEPAETFDEKVDYFTAFLKLQPSGTIDENWVRWASDDHTSAINSGIYTFQTMNGPVQARFTFVYQLVDGEWKIVEHHSSKMPETACDKAPAGEAASTAGRRLKL